MANTLTNLMPDLYESLDVVSRELVGFIPAVTWDASAARAALNQNIRVPITPASAAEDITPGQLPADDGDQTIGNTVITISKSRTVPFRWQGEEQREVNSNGPGYSNIRRDQIIQAMRTLTNEIEVFLGALFIYTSRAAGTAGTTPFNGHLDEAADVRKILDDNGCPMGDRHLVVGTTAGAQLRKNTQLTKALEAGTTEMRAQGTLLDLFGFSLRESAGVQSHTKGTGTSYVTSGTTAANATSVVLATGSGTVVAGDVMNFATDTADNYVVNTGVAAPGTIVLNAPGVKQAIATGQTATVGNNYVANMAFHRSSIVLVTRAPALPEEGDMASDRQVIIDPRSGLAFEIAVYPQYRRVRYEISCAYGAALIKPNHAALLMG